MRSQPPKLLPKLREFGDADMLAHEVKINGFDPDDMSRPPLTHSTIYDLSFVVLGLTMLAEVAVVLYAAWRCYR